MPLRVVTYNVHKCRGMDGRTMALRIADLRRAGADRHVVHVPRREDTVYTSEGGRRARGRSRQQERARQNGGIPIPKHV